MPYGCGRRRRDHDAQLASWADRVQASLLTTRATATASGAILALGILAMTVGLIRAEATGDLRTLTATGATGRIRRTITATTAGGLAVLGAVLGITMAYIGIAAGIGKHIGVLRQRTTGVTRTGNQYIAEADRVNEIQPVRPPPHEFELNYDTDQSSVVWCWLTHLPSCG